ncbi:MAG: ABC transporter permease [Deltaproteobacteria bacterium]|nr:ABC transporter permease [Deltaproteobacteria bacterium]
MNNLIQTIPFANLSLAFIPVFLVVGILYKWSQDHRNAIYAISRMLVQLLLVGYFLAFIFDSDSAWVILTVLAVMVFTSSWIALRTVRDKRSRLYTKAFLSLLLGGGTTLLIVTQGVLNLNPWYLPSYFIPRLSLAADRLEAETKRNIDYELARNIAFRSSLIPITNSLFAVGLVSIPGMMTGQILSGVSPLIAVRYQIMVMCMIYGASGISSACFLTLVKPNFDGASGISSACFLTLVKPNFDIKDRLNSA